LTFFALFLTPALLAVQRPFPVDADAAGTLPLEIPFAYDGPPAPAPPEVMTRDASGRAAVRAVRITSPIRVDGRLDEQIYATTLPVSGLIQVEPRAGEPATQNTEAWVLFDDKNVYVAVKCWEAYAGRMVANEMRRDANNIFNNDYLAFLFDTYYDRRNAYYFALTPVGGRADGQISNERQYSGDWNTVWDVSVGRFEGGWTIEAAIPFKSLRYRPGRAQIWGFNIERSNRWKYEESFLTNIPASFGFNRAWLQVSYSATLVGLEAPPGSKNIEVKPYLVSNLRTDNNATPRIANQLSGSGGLDVKYGVTQNLTADFTYNTDFAQVEADQQQINLTRFNLFFPEKREFFLENQGTFAFGGVTTSGFGAVAGDTPILFYSRRIGLSQGRAVPIEVGGRMTGRIGRFTLGLLNIQADAENDRPALSWGKSPDVPAREQTPATNFTVLRLKRDVLRRSSIGVIYTGRSVDAGTTTGSLQAGQRAGRNDAFGADATFVFGDNLSFNGYWARTRTPSLAPADTTTGDDRSYRAQIDYEGDRYGVQVERLAVGRQFDPQVGFVRRVDMRKNFASLRFSPRPRSSKRIRKYTWIGSMSYIENGSRRLETRLTEGEFDIEFQNSDKITVKQNDDYELVVSSFPVASITVPAGAYRFRNTSLAYSAGPQRRLSANITAEHGGYYGGHRTALGVGSGRLNLNPRLSLEPTMSINWLKLLLGTETTRLVGSRVNYTMSPRMFATALIQYNSTGHVISSNIRLRWEYRPGSELFVVYNEERDTLTPRFPPAANRAFIVKVNRLIRF
jgi:Domain of unknown function (DUF5916)